MNAVRVLRRIGLVVVIVVVVLACVVGLGGYYAIHRSMPDYRATVRIPGLSKNVAVYRDQYGVPQIYAASAEDLFRAEGYLQATDRFWEMDFRRHVTAGRLAELFGASQVDTDAYIRTMGWRRVAEQELPLLSPQSREYLNAYAEGVNAWLKGHSGLAASLEYGVLKLENSKYKIAPWTPVDSLSWLKAMAWDLRSNMADEIYRAEALASGLSTDQVRELYPDYPAAQNPPILSTGALVKGVFQPTAAPPASAKGPKPGAGQGGGSDSAEAEAIRSALGGVDLGGLSSGLAKIPQLLGLDGDGIGSNSWVVSGAHTATGKPILSNDPHLGAAMPSVWWQVGLHCTTPDAACPFDVSGFSFSGVPGVVIGHNARIAWGFTNLGPDVTDLFLERVTGNTYQRNGRQAPLAERVETIKVAGGKDVKLTIRSTVHGPLLSDQDSDLRKIGARPDVDKAGVPTAKAGTAKPAYAVALDWTALTPGRTMDALFALNTAADFSQFRNAASLLAVPAQNMIYADVEGNIGYQAPGVVPVRGSGDGTYPAPGWNSAYDWVGTVPFAQMPYVENPPSGYIVTANQAPVVDGAGPMLGYDWDYGYRSARIGQLLQSAGKKLSVSDMSAIEMDARSGLAPALVPALTGLHIPPGAKNAELDEARELLAGWDYQQTENSAAAAFFNAVWRHLLTRTFDELPNSLAPDGGSRWFLVVSNLLASPDSHWWDDHRTVTVEHRDDILRKAMKDALSELNHRLGTDPSKWRWGDLHTLTIQNQSFGTSGIGIIEWLFNRGPYPVAGGTNLVDATGWTPANGYQVDWVPSMRMIVDLADLDRSRWVNLTGASGHAFSSHYSDQTELWRTGRTTPMRWRPESIRREARYVQTLRP